MFYVKDRRAKFVRDILRIRRLGLFVVITMIQSIQLSLAQSNSGVPFSPEMVSASVVDTLASLLSNYVFPEVARNVEAEMLRRLEAGDYNDISSRSEFVSRISAELRELTNDGHMSIYAPPDQRSEPTYVIEETIDRFKYNFGFESARILEGNIGYLKFNKFYEGAGAIRTAENALMFLQHTDALILDLRENKGGSPDLVQYLLSYFFEEGSPLWSIVDRNEKVVFEAHALSDIPLSIYKQDFPIVVIATRSTASAAEMVTYTMKHAEKAEVIGQRTMGVAHLVGAGRINEYLNWRFSLSRPVNPVTNTSWEGVGVQPDIVASDAELFLVAYRRAIELVRMAASSIR